MFARGAEKSATFVTIAICTILILLVTCSALIYRTNSLVATRTSDGRAYRVIQGDPEAAESLARLNKNISLLIKQLQIRETALSRDQRKCLTRILERYRPTSLIETKPVDGRTAYTINKGEEVAICLRTTQNHDLHNDNELLLVMIHELAHIGSSKPDPNHGPEFQTNFDFLRGTAIRMGLLEKIGKPWMYCGTIVDPVT